MGQDQDPGPGRRGHARLVPPGGPPPGDAAQARVLYRAAGVLRERFPAARDTAAVLLSLAAVLERPGGGPPAQPPPPPG